MGAVESGDREYTRDDIAQLFGLFFSCECYQGEAHGHAYLHEFLEGVAQVLDQLGPRATVRFYASFATYASDLPGATFEVAPRRPAPLASPAAWMHGIRAALRQDGTSNLQRDPDAPYDPDEDRLFTVIDNRHNPA